VAVTFVTGRAWAPVQIDIAPDLRPPPAPEPPKSSPPRPKFPTKTALEVRELTGS
jgi:hypothetical protein